VLHPKLFCISANIKVSNCFAIHSSGTVYSMLSMNIYAAIMVVGDKEGRLVDVGDSVGVFVGDLLGFPDCVGAIELLLEG